MRLIHRTDWTVLSLALFAAACGKSSAGSLGGDAGTNPGALQLSTQTLPDGKIGEAYSAMLLATGGKSPYHFALADGSALPAGLTLGTDGTINGTPTAAGSARFVVAVTDSAMPAAQATGTLTLRIAPAMGQALQIDTAMLTHGHTGTAYTETLAASGGTTPYVWSISSGSLPMGIALSSDGKLSGTPASAGTSDFTVRVSDASSPVEVATATFTLTVDPGEGSALAISTPALPNARVGIAYTAELAASGGTAPYTWSLLQGSLPAGLVLSAQGQISGTASQVGSSSFVVQATDASSPHQTASTPLSITVDPMNGQALRITTTMLPDATVGRAYTGQLAATAGTSPYTWALDPASTLPPGLSLSGQGALTGSPTVRGRYAFTVAVSDSSAPAETASGSISLTVTSTNPNALNIATQDLPDAIVGIPYRRGLQARGGTRPYQWTVAAGALPQGLTLSAQGMITGTASVSGTFNFNVEVADSAMPQQRAEQTLTLLVLPAGTQILTITGRMLPRGVEGTPYGTQLHAMGGVPPYQWTVLSGMPPPGLTVSSTGAVSGTPSSAGAFILAIEVKDSGTPMQTAQRQLAIFVIANPNGPAIVNPVLPAGMIGQPYQVQLMVMGGTAPYALSLASGNLPPGLDLNAMTSSIEGTPTMEGGFTFTLKATDSATPALSTQHTYTVIVIQPQTGLRISTMALPPAALNMVYTATLAASNGTPPYNWSITNGQLPVGLTLGATGIIHGTPTQAMAAQFSVQVMDSATPPAMARRRFLMMVR